MMSFLALLISIVALILAYLAYTKSGGTADDLRQKVDELGISTEKIRNKTADALNKMEKTVRGEEHATEAENPSQQDAAAAAPEEPTQE